MRQFRLTLIFTLAVAMFAACGKVNYSNDYSGQSAKEDLALDMPPPPLVTEEVMPAEPGEEKPEELNREQYDQIVENAFQSPKMHPLSTFSIDVDVASYANVRRFLNDDQLPYPDAIRLEEMINYFDYEYPQPTGTDPFSINTEFAACPWNAEHKLLHIGLKGKEMAKEDLPPSNLVFLLDVSGSMNDPNKLPLLKEAFSLLVDQLGSQDRVAITVYAGAAGIVLPSTPASERGKILNALNRLQAGGSTAGGEGIKLAYKVATENFIEEGNNRVILATDGDFNVGPSSDSELVRMIEKKRETGIFLTVLGFGRGNYQDAKMEKLSNAGNGNFAYIDNQLEAKKVLVNEMGGTLFTIAKDVKIQVEFNPAAVKGYRLIGYENRLMAAEDFADDTKDAGELGAGHTVTALYEIVPHGAATSIPSATDLKYQEVKTTAMSKEELLTFKLRYKKPQGDNSKELVKTVDNVANPLAESSENFRFSAAVAGFGLLLRDSKYKGTNTYNSVANMARASKGADLNGYRQEFINLVEKAEKLAVAKNDANAKASGE